MRGSGGSSLKSGTCSSTKCPMGQKPGLGRGEGGGEGWPDRSSMFRRCGHVMEGSSWAGLSSRRYSWSGSVPTLLKPCLLAFSTVSAQPALRLPVCQRQPHLCVTGSFNGRVNQGRACCPAEVPESFENQSKTRGHRAHVV